MMGETGCGKTALIRKLSELINNGNNKMEILNIHAGTDNKDIIEFIEQIIPKARKLDEEEEKKKIKEKQLGNNYEKKKLWVFFDEINTCNSMGLLSEIICKHSYNGKKIDDNIVFIAACNPYRKITRTMEQNGLKYPGTQERKLVYTVNPLPFSLLNFVFDFGSLTEIDEKKYIDSIIHETLKKYYDDENNTQYKQLKELALNSLSFSHKFIKDKGDVSSVSLREIRRFNIFFDYFVEYFNKKIDYYNENEIKKNEYENFIDFDKYKNAIILSIFICYYLRICDKEIKASFEREINSIIKVKFRKTFEKEANFLLNEIKLVQGIAKNNALKRNIFTMFSAINARVPLFICGKPGSSKSLSVQLIFDSMKGIYSTSNFFKKFPSIIMNSFQGS